MRLVHRFSVNPSPQERDELAQIGLVVGAGFSVHEFNDSDPVWPLVRGWLDRNKRLYWTDAKFTSEEVARASWLQVNSTGPRGYPQPENQSAYMEITYDLSKYCPQCGIGAIQKAPFRMKGEPKWGRNGIVQLTGVREEFFAKPGVWKDVLEPLGVPCGPVLNSKGSDELKTVVQLVSTDDDVDADMDGHTPEVCRTCRRAKYQFISSGPFPHLRNKPIGHYVRTKQIFGSGGAADRAVLVSQDLVRALSVMKSPGVWYIPVEDT